MKPPTDLPTINRPMLGGFRWFVRRYLKQHFHSVAVNRVNLRHATIDQGDSLVVYANHASWWDPLAAIYLAEQVFADHAMFAPIDAIALQKYRMFARMGFFGVEQNSLRGAAEFLRIAEKVLSQRSASLWLTPEGRFADVRDQQAELMPGLSHLAAKMSRQNQQRVWFVSGAVEYTFWEERKPELLVWFGKPVCTEAMRTNSKHQWAEVLTSRLRDAQQQLATASIARDSQMFEVLSSGKAGSFFVYDIWRSMKNSLAGRAVCVEHGDKLRK